MSREALAEAVSLLADGLFDFLADIDMPDETLAALDSAIRCAALVRDGDVRGVLDLMGVEPSWYWVTPIDNVDALGDYGGFTFQTRAEAEDFIQAEYREWFRLQRTGYHEESASPDLLMIESVITASENVIDPVRVEDETPDA